MSEIEAKTPPQNNSDSENQTYSEKKLLMKMDIYVEKTYKIVMENSKSKYQKLSIWNEIIKNVVPPPPVYC